MKLVEREHCTGCGACMAVCPKGAISFQSDDEGFPTPVIDDSKCIECGQCSRVCLSVNFPTSSGFRASYAAQITDKEALEQSSSGGLFTVLAREIFRRKGIVYGCVWDQDYNAVVTGAENEQDLAAMRGSKYVWSWAGDTFPEIKKQLMNGRTVLFTGLPCQAAGLKNYLGKEYDNLYLSVFFCGGAPSPFAFQEYLKTITKTVPKEKLDFKFRDKSRNGVGVYISYNTENGRAFQTYVQNPYFFSYHTKVFHRRSCYACKYRYSQRIEDITIGDYWGVSKFHSEFSARDGVSSLLVNTDKGQELFDCIKDDLQLAPTKIENITEWNNLTLGDRKIEFKYVSFRDDFFRTLKKSGWKAAEKRYLVLNKKRIKLWLKDVIPSKYWTAAKKLLHRES